MRKLFLILMTLMACTWSMQAQTRTYHGTVLDASDNEPLVGATIMPVGGGQGVAADVDGKFTLTVPANVTKAHVSYVGYTTQEVNLSDGMVVRLHSGAANLDETIVVAYGTAKKSAYTGSASVVKADQIEKSVVTDAINALKGAVPGVQITSANGQPGAEPNVYIRGIGSLNAGTAPLYVVDGVPFDGSISTLNTRDIASMTVLKDAAAAALYGARGANGVILITTKQGRQGNVKITVDAKWGGNSREITNYDVINNPVKYYELGYQSYNFNYLNTGYDAVSANLLANESLINALGYPIFTAPAGQQLIGMNGLMNPYATLGWSDGSNFYTYDNWADEGYRNGFRQEYNIAASGATDKLNYYLSFGYLGDEGVIRNSNYNRLSTRASVDYQVKKWLKLGTNLNYTYIKSGWPSGQTSTGLASNVFSIVNNMAPVYPFYVRNAEGEIMTNPATGGPLYDYGTGDDVSLRRNGYMPGANPIADLVYNYDRDYHDVFNGRWFAEITPVEGLTITGNIGLMLDHYRNHSIYNPYYGTYAPYGGFAAQVSTRTRSLNIQGLANYQKSWGDNNFDFLLGYESYDWNNEYLQGEGMNLYDPNSWAVNNTLENTNRKGYGYSNTYATRGIFGRINYDYDGTYYASVSYRRDASSRFAPKKRWGNFFSVSVGWDISKMKFMEEATWVDMLKFKASFGQQGNDAVGNYYAYLDQYQLSGTDSWSDGELAYKGNPDLTWETSNAFNIGFDFSFFQGRLEGSLEYFQRQTSDMLYYRPVAPSLGYSSIPMNVGSIRNYGIEIDLNGTLVKTKDIAWTINVNGTWIQNKVLKLHPDLNGEFIDGSRIYREGDPMYQYYIVNYAGVAQEPVSVGGTTYPAGSPLYWAKDADGVEYKTPVYQTARTTNRKVTGNILPTFYGGFGTSFTCYGFDLSLSASYQLGGRMFDSGWLALMHQGGSNIGTNWHKDILKAWTPENTNTNIPALNSGAGDNEISGVTTDYNLVSSNYLSLDNITVGYTFPEKWTSKAGISGLRIYFAGENIAISSHRKGLDPRKGFTSANAQTYSAVRNLSGGVQFTF